MTDGSNETTEALPTVEPTVDAAEAPVVAPAPVYRTPEHTPPNSTSKVMITVAAVVLGFAILGGTFASGVMVGSRLDGGRAGTVAGQRGGLGGMKGGRGGRGGQLPPQRQTAPQSQPAPGDSTGQPQ